MCLLRLVEGDLQCVISSRDVGDDKMFDIRLSDEDIFDLIYTILRKDQEVSS